MMSNLNAFCNTDKSTNYITTTIKIKQVHEISVSFRKMQQLNVTTPIIRNLTENIIGNQTGIY